MNYTTWNESGSVASDYLPQLAACPRCSDLVYESLRSHSTCYSCNLSEFDDLPSYDSSRIKLMKMQKSLTLQRQRENEKRCPVKSSVIPTLSPEDQRRRENKSRLKEILWNAIKKRQAVANDEI